MDQCSKHDIPPAVNGTSPPAGARSKSRALFRGPGPCSAHLLAAQLDQASPIKGATWSIPIRPLWSSEVTRATPERPRATSERKNAVQPAPSSVVAAVRRGYGWQNETLEREANAFEGWAKFAGPQHPFRSVIDKLIAAADAHSTASA